MNKLYDLAVKTGTYQDRNGNEKGRYKNIGAVMEKDGNKFLFIDRTFNPAGVPARDGSDSIIVSMFKPREDDAPAAAPTQTQHHQAKSNGYAPDSDIPF